MKPLFMDITYLGHSSFRIKGRGATIVTDPFDPEMVGIKYPKLSEIDVVTVSHTHADHAFFENVKDPKVVLDSPGEYEVSGVSILGIPTYHDDKNGQLRGKNTVFVFEIDGIRIAHLGDLGHKFSQETIEDLGEIDILMVPVGGYYTIDAQTAWEVIREIEPSYIIPMHFRRAEMKAETFKDVAPLEDFLKESGMTVEKTDKLSLKKADLTDAESKVVVLEI